MSEKRLSWVSGLAASLALICAATVAQGAEQSWDELVAAAKKEGKVVVAGPPDAEVRRKLPEVFEKRFGIPVEYLGGRSSQMAAKLRNERGAGLYTLDVAIGGLSTLGGSLYGEKMLDPMKPVLIHPEVVDKSKWKKGDLWFSDPEGQYILRLSNSVQKSFYINTSVVKEGTLTSVRDLLKPEWKGKFAMDDPTVSGSGLTMASRFYLTFGEDFLKKLYVDQQPKLTRDRRQLTDWLVRGTYPVAFGADDDEVFKLQQQGFPLENMDDRLDLPATLSAGYGMVGLLNKAPHPNAAKLFVNWLASKEGAETYARARGESSTRNDIDELAFLPAAALPRAGAKYVDTYDWEFVMKTRDEMRKRMKEILKH